MLAGDWHGNQRWAERVITHAVRRGVDTIVQLGDFGYWRDESPTTEYLAAIDEQLGDAGLRMFWLDGNHEDHTRRAEWLAAADHPLVQYLPRGFRWRWWDATWMSVGGAMSVDREFRIEGESWWPQEELTDADVEYAMRDGDVDVLLSHDCPRGVDIPGVGPDTKGGVRGNWPPEILLAAQRHRDRLAAICAATQPNWLFHGHYHIPYESTLDYGTDATTTVVGLADDRSTLERNTRVLRRNDLRINRTR